MKVTDDLLRRNWTKKVNELRSKNPDFPQLPLTASTVTYPGDFELQNGRLQAFYLGSTHSAGDIFIWFPQERVLDAGSILKEHLGNLANANLVEYPKALHKLQQMHLDIRIIISGHWSAIHGPELIDQYLKMLGTVPLESAPASKQLN